MPSASSPGPSFSHARKALVAKTRASCHPLERSRCVGVYETSRKGAKARCSGAGAFSISRLQAQAHQRGQVYRCPERFLGSYGIIPTSTLTISSCVSVTPAGVRSVSKRNGFTLIETLITTAILGLGLIAVASLFSYATGTNYTNGQRTSAMLLLYEKMETFRSTPITGSLWTAGGGLNTAAPVSGYFDYASISTSGAVTVDTTSTGAPYLRVWQVTGTNPRTVTVIVCAQRAGLTGQRMELARATTIASSRF
jgi:prepilin-type N-terminal cleavage/methylation domain-containing protein